MRRLLLISVMLLQALASQACVGKFLSNLLSTENAQFKVLEAVPVSNTKILVGFNKPLDYTQGALILGNYSIPGLNLVSVTKGPETNQVYLLLDPNDSVRMQRQYYTLTVSGVKNVYWDDLLPGAENRSKQFMGARWLRATCIDDAGLSTCPASGTSMATDASVTVRGDYAKGQAYRWALSKWNGTAYVAETTGLAHSPAAQSPVININTPFTVPSAIGTGDFRLEILVQDDAGAWQPAADTTYYLFTVDNTPVNNIGLSNVPAALTSSTVTAINVVYRNCVDTGFPNGFAAPCYSPSAPVAAEIPTYYKYRVGTKAGAVAGDCSGAGYAFGAWSASRAANLPIVEVFGTSQCYNIQVVAADNVGNYQCDTGAGTCSGYGTVDAFFAAKPHQEARFLLDNSAPTAAFDNNTLPVNPTSATSFAVVVDATGIDKYRFRVVGTGFSGTWSTDKTPGAAGELITGAGLTSGNYTIELIGKDAAGNYQSTSAPTSHSFTVDTTAPSATISSRTGTACNSGKQSPTASGLPANPTNVNCVDVQIGGSGVTKYKYKWVTGSTCGAGGYSAEMDAPTQYVAVNPLGWTDGTTYSLCVIGSNGIVYQGEAETSVTRYTFQYDTTPPTSQIGTWVTPALNLTGKSTVLNQVSVSIAKSGAEEITSFKGVISAAACPAAATMAGNDVLYPPTSPQSPLQATGLSTGTIHICFIARDAAGNWESSTHDVSYTVFTPPAPTDGGGALDAQYTNSFNFSWVTGTGIPADTKKIFIRLCKDAACSNPLPGMNNGKEVCASAAACAAISSYTVNDACGGLDCLKQVNGENYYAQLKVVDSIDQESIFGSSSNGKVIVGQVAGFIRNTLNAPVAGATVGIYQSDCSTQIGGNVASAADGAFTFSLGLGHTLPLKLASQGYCIKTTSGSLQGSKKFIEAKPGAVTAAGTVYAVDTSGSPGCIIGAIVDGSTGSQLLLSNATFTLKDFANNTVASTPALDPDGKQFIFPSACASSWGAAPYSAPTYDYGSSTLSPGVYTLDVTIPGYYAISESVAISNAATTNMGALPVVGTFAAGSRQIKIILTWGNQTKDLDLHLVGPSSGIDCQPYNEAAIQNAVGAKFHVSYQQRYCAETGTSAPNGSTSLAVDDSFEYGPEIINFYDGYADGTYKVSVYNNDLPRRVGTTTSGSAVVTGLSSTSDLAAGMHVRGVAGIPASTTISSVDSATQVTLSANATASGVTLLDFTRNWNVSKARIDVYAGSHFAGGGGLIKTVISSGSSELRGWKPLRMLVSGTSLTVDDVTGVGYADFNYGLAWTRPGTRTNGSTTVTGLSTTADLVVGMRVSGRGIANNTTIAAILSATSVQLSANATSNGTDSYGFVFNTCAGGTIINGPSDGLTAGATPAAGLNPADPNLDCGLFLNGTTVAGGAGPLDW